MSHLAPLRTALRRARRALSRDDQRAHARQLTRTLQRHYPFVRARRIAAYWPCDGELDVRPLMRRAQQRGQSLYLPVLARGLGSRRTPLLFAPYRPGMPMRPNRFGILEPAVDRRHRQRARDLDILLMPLVGFDGAGNRLGMGGGYYDRTLARLNQRRLWRRPRLIGIAHECQRVPQLDARPWDVRLDLVATERCLEIPDRRS
ncbi:5-formyltetrahydrofolate cyclo-ligase [Thiocapsa imhoffii]|uniref:5-formyltetrahydrofolate cyclo-ligase n=1 Tax=Thiocapsa imhoffii TaxID=382777 RepID=A0A9X1B812_9GAMM|nr:5-formyltetrahydrofolate cyclo-ligase [Thiocapsa imhoffii]MBK1643476.1 5-formyltetrahydrofolate cyclo-ligase [Thiocapsa imhoffii]